MLSCFFPTFFARRQDEPHAEQETIATASPHPARRKAGDGLLGGLTALSSSSKRRSSGEIPSHEVPLAGYLLIRSAMGEPVEQQDIPRLRRTNDTVQETRARFPHGRGNVATDIAASNHACSRRAQAAHDVLADLMRDSGARLMLMNPTLAHAAISEFVQGGHCAGYSAVAMALHAPKLAPGETVHYVQRNHRDHHDWTESRVDEGHHQTIVMDAWAEGPAVFARDSRFAADARCSRERSALTPDEGRSVPAQMAANTRYLQENYSHVAETHLERLAAQEFSCAPGEVWQAQPVLSEAFRARGNERLAALARAKERGANLPRTRHHGAVLNKMAIESARALGVGGKAASAAADAIITAAYRLGE